MAGITDFGAYVPIYRLGPQTEDWTAKTERSVANFDEDSLTMAVAAAEDALRGGADRATVDALYLASTTVPYEEKQGATLVSVASDLTPNVFATDIGHSLRAGTLALTMAIDAAGAGRIKNGLVIASDCRTGPAGSDFERSSGDGAAALLVGNGNEVAVLEHAVSVVNEILDVWRASGESMVRNAEDRFAQQEGYLQAIQQVAAELKARTGRTVDSFDRIVLYAPTARVHAEAARLLGAPAAKVQDPMFDRLGSTGAAAALMQLVAALEQAAPNESILVLNYGDGADALAFRTTDRIAEVQKRAGRRGVRGQLASKFPVPTYADYLKWRGLLSEDSGVRRPSGSGPSPAALHREQDQVLRFHGVKCKNCATVMYPPQRICIECRAKDQFDSVRLAGQTAKLFTYSMDYIAGTADVPLVLTIVDFDMGGRAVLMMTDRDVNQVKIEMPLEVTFRLSRGGAGIKNYYWKCMPVRGALVPA